MTQLLAVALLLLFSSAEEPPVVRGRLCIADLKSSLEKCSDATGTKLGVPAADAPRAFSWTSADGTITHLGLIPPKSESIDLSQKAKTATLELSLEGEASRGWPADVGILVSPGARGGWRWTVDGEAATRLRRIVVPRGTYSIELRAGRHQKLTRARIDAHEATVTLGELRLRPLAVARGVVVDEEEKAVANAVILLPDGNPCATANEQGAFECELKEPTPEALVVSKAGFGPRELPLDRALDKDVDLGRITLSAGRTLTLKIVRPEASTAQVTLFRDADDRYEHSKLKTHELRETEEEVRFDVGEGTYYALVAGDDALERIEVPFTIEDADVTETITIAPFRLLGNVRFGEELLADGTAEIISPQHTWRARLPIAGGAFGGTMWQTGKVKAIVLQELLESPALGADPTRWDVKIDKRLLAGRIYDAATKKPVPDAKMSVVAEMKSGKLYTSAKVTKDATYEIVASQPGTYSLRVTSPRHVSWSADVHVTEEDKLKTVDVALEAGVVLPLEIVTPAGAPVANATILEGVKPDRNNPEFITAADGRGRYELRGRPGETRLLYVVPRDGSFAVVRARIPRSNDEARPLQVIVAPATSALRVRSIRDGEPVPAGLLIRYDGELVPPAMLRFVTKSPVGTYPSGEAVLPRLPAGSYEVWALAGQRDEEALIASNGALRAPVRTGLSGGEQVVEVTAPPREERRRP